MPKASKKTKPIKAGPDHRPWSRGLRTTVSILILIYGAIVLLGPLSTPTGSVDLIQPMTQAAAPVHQALFLGHGYRYFGPDPGPGHLLVYRINTGDKIIEGQFPDRNQHWPRLLYHRWFMLSETLFEEHVSTPVQEEFDLDQQVQSQQIKLLQQGGQTALARRLEARRKTLAVRYEQSRDRIEELVRAVAVNVLKKHGLDENHLDQIELFIQERSIPYPADVLLGKRLDAPEFLSEPVPIYPISEVEPLPRQTTTDERAGE